MDSIKEFHSQMRRKLQGLASSPVLASNYPDAYSKVGTYAAIESVEWHVAEREVLGCDHAQVGAYLLGLWGLPSALIQAVAWRHYPTQSATTEFGPLTAVHVADVLVHAQSPTNDGTVCPEIDFLYIAQTDCLEALEIWRGAAFSVNS